MELKIYKYDFVVLITLALALFATVFNSYHLHPGFDLYHNLIIGAIVAIGLSGCFLFRSKEVKVPYSVVTWLLLLGLIFIQPLINTIIHPDYLIFPIGTLVLTVVFSIAVANIKDKNYFLNRYLVIFIGFMLLSVAIQFMQLRGYKLTYNGFVVFPNAIKRFDANFTQPNQAAFMFALSELACLYFYNLKKNKVWILWCTLSIIGIALTASRGGLVLGVAAIVLFNIFYAQSLVKRVRNIIYQLLGFTTIYSFGIFVYKKFSVSASQSMSAVERLGQGADPRISFQEQAYYMFQHNPLTGYGWGSFTKGSIDYASELGFLTFSRHSHFFLTQIASELGILGLLCLLPIIIFVIKKISFKMDAFNAVCFTAISIIVLYSCSEFPLWNLRFLIIFAMFVTLIDSQFLFLKSSYSKILLITSMSISLLAVFYIFSYLNIYSIIKKLAHDDLDDDEVEVTYANIPDIFGMSVFKENILFHYIPINSNAIDDKLHVGERATATELNKRNLFRYAQLLALNNEPQKSVRMFKAACAFNWKGNCENVINELNKVAEVEPQTYQKIQYEVEKWVVDFAPK